MKKIILGLFVFTALNLFGAEGFAAKFVQEPTIKQNPNDAAPLVAIINFTASEPVKTEVTVNDGDRTWVLPFAKDKDPKKGLVIAGMRADRKHEFTVTIIDDKGKKTTAKKKLSYKTPPLPEATYEFPPLHLITSKPEKMQPGFTILSIRRGALGRSPWLTKPQMKFARFWGILVGVDNKGEVVWYYKSPDIRISGVEYLKNGNILFHLQDFRTREIDFAGNIIHEWYAEKRFQGPSKTPGAIPVKGLVSLHHQPHEMPNGNFLAMSAHPKLIKNYPTSTTDPNAPRKDMWVMGDKIVEFDKKGNVVWEWDSFDYLDPYRLGYGAFDSYWHTRGYKEHVDWTHGNGVTYDPKDDSIIMSLRHQDVFVKVDRKTKEIKWLLGPHGGWNADLSKKLLKPIGKDFRWPWHGHNPRVTEEGTIILYDNAIYQARPFDKITPVDEIFSRGVEYKINEKDMTVEQLWSSSKSYEEKDSVFSWAMSDAHRFPNKNHMVIDTVVAPKIKGLTLNDYDMKDRHVDDLPTWSRIREYYKDTDEVVFELQLRDLTEVMYWQAFGGVRVNLEK